ncbi:MAG: polysaccharide deacetylase family protein [Erysipelotrichaceae bacterium]|nr:polysaccharide deacetylase family protein [Erysipelotrichaceae bacterium]
MQTLQKRTKRLFLGLILGLSCLIGCSSETVNKDDFENIEKPIYMDDSYEINTDLLNVKTTTTDETSLYRVINNELVDVGKVNENIDLDMSDIIFSNCINIKDTDLYVNSDNLKLSDRWYEKRNNLIPYNQNLQTTSMYSLYDFKGNLLFNINSQDDYPIYVLGDDINRYGILFQNEILYIDSKDIINIYENNNSNELIAKEIPVLMYHFFYSQENGETRVDGNYVEVNEFNEHLLTIKDEGFITLTMQEVLLFMEERAKLPEKSVVITIDDGDPSVLKYAYPLIKEYKMNATMFLITATEDPVLNYDYIMMREDGIELQSHSWLMHTGGCPNQGHGGRLQCVDYETGVQDTKLSFDYVDGGFVYCYPFGDVNEHAKSIIKDGGAKLAFTTAYGKIKQGMDLLELPRIRVTGGNGISAFKKSIY